MNEKEYLDIVNTVFYEGKEYLEINLGDRIAYYKENYDHTFSEITKEQYEVEALAAKPMKVENSRKPSNRLLHSLKSIICAIITATVLSTTMTGCATNTNNNNPTVTEAKADSQFDNITLDELQAAGFEFIKSQASTDEDPNDIYYVTVMNVENIPENNIVYYYYSNMGTKRYSIYAGNVPEEYDAKLIFDKIDNSDIDPEYKTILKESIEKIINLNNPILTSNLITNLKKARIYMDYSIPTAEFEPMTPYIRIGDLKRDYSEEAISALEQQGYSEKDIKLVKEGMRYILTHELGHAATNSYIDEENGVNFKTVDKIVVRKSDHVVLSVDNIGESYNESSADFVTYDVTKVPASIYQGYSINQVFYIALLDVLGVNNMDFISASNTLSLISLGYNKGYMDIDLTITLLDMIKEDTLQSYQTFEGKDYSYVLNDILMKYVTVEQEKGTSNEEILETIDKVSKDITQMVNYNNENFSNIVYGSMGLEKIELSKVINDVKSYVNSNAKTK